MRLFILALTLTLTLALTLSNAFAAEKSEKTIAFDDAFLRETPAKVSAGYVAIRNLSDRDDSLIGVSTEWAERAELHDVKKDEHGTLTMFHVDDLSAPANETLNLAPGGAHLMFFGVKKPLVAGQSENVTLHFLHAGKVDVAFAVKPMTYRGKHAKNDKQDGHHGSHH